MGVLEGSRLQVKANQIKEALVCRESCAADARPMKYEPQDSSLALLPKSEQQPNAPGLLFWFLSCLEGESSEFSRYEQWHEAGIEKSPRGVFGPRHGLKFSPLSGSYLLLLAEAKPVQMPLLVSDPALNTHAATLHKVLI